MRQRPEAVTLRPSSGLQGKVTLRFSLPPGNNSKSEESDAEKSKRCRLGHTCRHSAGRIVAAQSNCAGIAVRGAGPIRETVIDRTKPKVAGLARFAECSIAI